MIFLRTLLAAALLVGLSPRAHAEEATDWTGLYAGAFFGYLAGKLNSNDPTHATTTGNYDDDGKIFGIFGGYRQQTPSNWVFGGQVDLPLYMDRGTAVDTTFFPGIVTYEAKPKFGALFSLQLGHAVGNVLPFLYGGVGLTRVEGITRNVNNAGAVSMGFVQSASATHFVWEIGGGLDFHVMEHVVLGGKVGYFHVAKADHTMPWSVPGPNLFGYNAVRMQVNAAFQF